MQERALYGLSIGCTVGEFTRGTKPNEPRRTIKTIKSPPEVSLTTFPMNELAGTRAVKAADIRTVRDFEDALRELLGSSHAAAKSMASVASRRRTSGLRGSTVLSHRRAMFAGKFRAYVCAVRLIPNCGHCRARRTVR
jgi:hypothetical protein